MRYTTYSAQGNRKTQEDRLFVHEFFDDKGVELGLFVAVMDGHGGHAAAEHIREHLPGSMPIVSTYLRAHSIYPVDVMCEICSTMRTRVARTRSGTTFCAALIDTQKKELTIATIGDSVALIAGKGGLQACSVPHNTYTHKADMAHIKKNGGRFGFGGILAESGGGLTLTRALGDSDFTKIIREPDIIHRTYAPGEALLLASDGVITTHHSEKFTSEIHRIALSIETNTALDAEAIVCTGMDLRDKSDNGSAILVRL